MGSTLKGKSALSAKRETAKPIFRGAPGGKAKKTNRKRGEPSSGIFPICMPWLARITGVVLLAFFLVFVHDLLTQTRFLEIRNIETHGLEGLEREEILLQAAIPERSTLYGINLNHVRTRLEAHPFIREAKISRNLPGGLNIRIVEEKPFAILRPNNDHEDAFLANAGGRVFKLVESKPEMYGDYVVIEGLPLVEEKENQFWFEQAKAFIELWNREMPPPADGKDSFVLRVDPDLGIFVNKTEIARQISFGLSDYGKKIALLKDLIAFQQLQNNTEIIDRIDLVESNRIVLVPAPSEEKPPVT